MKYLKRFNENHLLYKEVSYTEFVHFKQDEKPTYLNSEVNNFIKELVDDPDFDDRSMSFNTETMGIDIFEYTDEWFKVSIIYFGKNMQEYFICDQMEGLKSLLKNKISNDETSKKI